MPTRRLNTAVVKTRIGYKDADGNGSTTCYVTEFINAITQVRSIATDGVRWFVQGGDRRQPFTIVGESDVPQEVKDRIAAFRAAQA